MVVYTISKRADVPRYDLIRFNDYIHCTSQQVTDVFSGIMFLRQKLSKFIGKFFLFPDAVETASVE